MEKGGNKKIQGNSVDNFGNLQGVNYSAKKRKPTLMPFNLPGDDLEHLEKND
jgi:hypothetical protein